MKRIKFIFSALLACGLISAVWADLEPIEGNVNERLDSLENKTENILSKAGILFGGEFYSRALSSKISGPITKNRGVSQVGKTTENLLFTGLDLNIEARPLDAVGGIAIVRLYQDWRNMFGSMANPLTLRWIAIEGNVKNIFTYNVGDYKQKYTPFTVWTPEPEIMFEPTVFARQREIAMGEEFLGDNNRLFQGVNLNFGAKVAPGLQELRLGAFGTRLRQTGAEKFASEGTPLGVDNYDVNMDRYAAGFNTDMKFIPGTQLGGSFIYITDARRTSKLADAATWRDTDYNTVFSGRARIGSEMFKAIDSNDVSFGLKAEFAGSNYNWYTAKDKKYSYFGAAFKGSLDGNFRFGENGLKLNAGFLRNTQEFRNELAQSPALYKNRILNTGLAKSQTYNIFDALYTSVFSYMPGEGETGIKQPIKKSAWTRSTLNWSEVKDNYALIEQSLNGALPLGEATPNRSGLIADLDFDFMNKAILVGGKFNFLQEMQEDTVFSGRFSGKTTQTFTEFGGGASFDIAKFGNWWAYPFVISGSYMHTMVDNFGGNIENENDVSFVNAGLYWKFWKRLALMGGFQLVKGVSSNKTIEETTTQSQWAGGFEYTVVEGGVLNATIGQVNVDYAASKNPDHNNRAANNFSSLRLDLNLTVKF